MTLEMRIGLGQFNVLTDEKLAYIKQLGADDFLMNTPKLPGEKRWELEDLVDRVHRIREAVGPHMDLAIDLHGRYDATAGMKFAHALEGLNLMWLEEPVPPENIDALKRITDSTRTPICAGENAYLRYGFRDMLEQQAVDIIMPDISKCGGLSECRKIANMAETLRG